MEDLDYEVANAAEWQTVDRKKTKPVRNQPQMNHAVAAQTHSHPRRPPHSARSAVKPTTIRSIAGNSSDNGASTNAFSKLAELERRKTPSPPIQHRAMNGIVPRTPVPLKSANTLTQRNRSNSASPWGTSGTPDSKGTSVIKWGRNAFRNAESPTAKVELPVPYSQFRDSVLKGLPGLPPGIAGELLTFNYITEQAGAYVPPPRNDAQSIGIWAPPAQAQEAARIIRSLLFNEPLPGPQPPIKKSNKGEKFATTNQKAMQKAEAAEAKRRNESIMESLRERPENPSRFSETLLFLWPDAEFPMHKCLGGDRLKDFDYLRQKTGCHIYIDEVNPSCIRVEGDDPAKITKIMQGFRLHWAGLLAKTNVKVKAYFVEVPPVRADIAIDVRTRRGSTVHTPRPYDLENGEDPTWISEAKFLQAKNAIRLREGVERSLQALKYSKGHLRMRVNFGTFVLREYQGLRDGRTKYTFEEFRNVLLLSRTKGYLDSELSTEHRQGLLSRCLQRKDILTLFNPRHSSLEDTLPSYTITFNYLEGDASLRLEVEFHPTPRGGYERGNKTWYKTIPEDDIELERPILQVGIMDFERSDWELDIKLMGSPTDSSNISRSLKEFANLVALVRSEVDDPATPGRLRVSFPVEQSQNLKSIQQKTSLRYRIKQTNYVLEIARYDTFQCTPSVNSCETARSFTFGVPRVSETAVTTWGASLYDTTWDDYIGQNATSRCGENVHWKPSIKSFFPSSDPETKDNVYAGFSEFLELVKEVSQMLCPEHKLPPPIDADEATKREDERKQSPALEDIIPFDQTWASVRRA
ncbi:hypothetical protein KEM54_004822 [Ascosphaera aggregata]|nr:hypothetical protein KEM54_004822 [Ascosphaera aggregata]